MFTFGDGLKITILVKINIMKIIFSRKGFDSTAGGIPSIKIGKKSSKPSNTLIKKIH